MSCSASVYSKVDKSWPTMSDSTQARIDRLRELERIRLEKQAALSAKRNSVPVPMPKFESRIQSSRTDIDSSENKENISEETKKLSRDVISERDKKEDVKSDSTLGVSRTQIQTDMGNSQTITEVLELPVSPRTDARVSVSTSRYNKSESVGRTNYSPISKVSEKLQDNERKEDSDTKTLVEKDSMSPISDQSKVVTEPARTLSTSYVSGPLSPTSTEKTKISVVRKMKLDSLPSVKMTTHEQVSTHTLPSSVTDSAVSVQEEDNMAASFSKETNENKENLQETSVSTLVMEPLVQESAALEVSPVISEVVTLVPVVPFKKEESQTVQKSENEIKVPDLDSCKVYSASNRTTTSVRPSRIARSNATEVEQTSVRPSRIVSGNVATEVEQKRVRASSLSETQSAPVLTPPSEESSTNYDKADQPGFRLETLALKQTLEVSARLEEKFSSVDDRQSTMAKLEELKNQREQRKKALEEESQEDLTNLTVRERFFRNQSSVRVSRPARQQTIPEQIRASRLSRRNSDLQASRAASPGKAAEAESPPLARRSRVQQRSIDRLRRRTIDSVPHLGPASSTRDVSMERTKPKPVVDIDSIGDAFARPDQERLNRIEELDRLRIKNKELMKRRDSAPLVNSSDGIASASSRLDFPSTLFVNRGSTENIAQYPIHEHLESSFAVPQYPRGSTEDVTSRARELLRTISIDRATPSVSRPPLRSSYSESRLFPLDGGRLTNSGILSLSTETEQSELHQSTNQQQSAINEESDDTPVYIEGAPQGTPVIDQEGRTHWVAPTSPKLSTYLSVIDHMENRNRGSLFESSYMPPVRPRSVNLSNSLLDASNQDHFLAECFDKKFTLKERCAFIRDKIYGKKEPGKAERGKPDGASHDTDNYKSKMEASSI